VKRRYASKAAADRAAELGLADVAIVGTGRDGLVTIEDVRRAAPVPLSRGDRVHAAVLAEYGLGVDERWRLDEISRLEAELQAIEDALERDGPVVRGSRGQTRPHPLLHEARQHRIVIDRLWRGMGLKDADLRADTDGREQSLACRRLARQRWRNRGGG